MVVFESFLIFGRLVWIFSCKLVAILEMFVLSIVSRSSLVTVSRAERLRADRTAAGNFPCL